MPVSAITRVRSSFEEYRNGLIHSWLRILTALGFCLIPLFFLLDLATMPRELLGQFGLYRGAATLFTMVQALIVYRTRPAKFSYLHGYAFTVVVGLMITQMTVDLGGFNSAYYAGLNLVMVAVNLLLPWKAVHSAINGLLILGMYVVANALLGGKFDTQILINNLYFLAATVIICIAISYSKHQLIEKEFGLREELLDVNENLSQSRAALKAARDALWGEMEVAKRIQTALLPRNQTLGGYDASALMLPADEVGGDYYDLLHSEAGEHWVAIGDVSGHGVESGLVMMMTQTSFVSTINDLPGKPPSAAYRAINRVLRHNIARLGTTRYMTLNLVRLDADGITVAGKHQDLLIYRAATSTVEEHPTDGCWIGVVPDTQGHVRDTSIKLGANDVLLLFSDGVTEATSLQGEMFGQERLKQALAQIARHPLDAAVQSLVQTIKTFAAKQDDDITVLLLRKRA